MNVSFYDAGKDVNENIVEIIIDSTAIKELEETWSQEIMTHKHSVLPTAWINTAIRSQRVRDIIILLLRFAALMLEIVG